MHTAFFLGDKVLKLDGGTGCRTLLKITKCARQVTALCNTEVTSQSGVFKSKESGVFPGGPVVKTLSFPCRGMGSIPDQS